MYRSASCPRALVLSALGLSALGIGALACGTENNYYQLESVYASSPDAGVDDDDDDDDDEAAPPPRAQPPVRVIVEYRDPPPSKEEPKPDAGAPSEEEDPLPVADVAPEALAFDVFETVGTSYYFVVSDEQLALMNEEYFGGGGFPGGLFGDIYTPIGGGGDVTFVDHLFVTTNGDAPHTADFGQVQVKLVGESTGRPWTMESLPNLKIDSDEFTDGKRISGVKHMRFNNAVVGSIFREKLTLNLYEKLGYPAPRATYAWVQSNVWGSDIKVPYILVESYKPQFCKAREATLGGECLNMWEFPGDYGYGGFAFPENCQFAACDSTNVSQFETRVVSTPPGPGYKAALADKFDWNAFHQFQCLSWILATGDDALHNMNNLVVMERADGMFQHLPYSVDISLGQDWYPTVELAGQNSIAQGCQSDPQCWDDTIATCETLVANFRAADPVGMLNQIYSDLSNRDMLRNGDEGRYRQLVSYLERRMVELPAELELNREGPYYNYCGYPLIECGGYCMYPEECYVCQPGQPEPFPGEEGEPDDEPADDEDDEDQGGAGGASGLEEGVAGSAMAGVDDEEAQELVVGPGGDIAVPDIGIGGGGAVPPPGGGGGACLPPIDYYDGPIFIR